VYFFFPETAGLSLEAIDLLYASGQLKMSMSEQREHAYHRHSVLESKAKVTHEEYAKPESDSLSEV
jgi:hypothetical protein